MIQVASSPSRILGEDLSGQGANVRKGRLECQILMDFRKISKGGGAFPIQNIML